MQTLKLGQELDGQYQIQSRRLNGLAQYLHAHHFARVSNGGPSENQLAQMLHAIENGETLPFDETFLVSFVELAARYLSDGDILKEPLILDRLALAASLDILRDSGTSLPNI